MDDRPLLLHREVGARVVRAWQCGDPASWRFRVIRIGRLPGGRWYVELVGRRRGIALECRDEARAAELAAEWMSDGAHWNRTEGR